MVLARKKEREGGRLYMHIYNERERERQRKEERRKERKRKKKLMLDSTVVCFCGSKI